MPQTAKLSAVLRPLQWSHDARAVIIAIVGLLEAFRKPLIGSLGSDAGLSEPFFLGLIRRVEGRIREGQIDQSKPQAR